MVSTLKRLELRNQQCAALRATADALDAALAEALDEKRALRNRLVSEIAEHLPGDYESRRAEAEAKVIEFEDAFRAAMLRRKPSMPPNACSMRAYEMKPKAQCSGRRRACTCYV